MIWSSIYLAAAAVQIFTCPLVPTGPAPHGQLGLSKYWAQEYVGADLARVRLQVAGIELAAEQSESVAIWDGLAHHGVRVSNLIAGSHPAALIPAASAVGHLNMVTFWTKYSFNAYVDNYQHAADLVHQRQHYDFYLNNSMEWNHSARLREIFQDLAAQGVTTITSNGNGQQTPLDRAKVQLAQESTIILATSLDPWGNLSGPAAGPAVPIIAAGADQHLTSVGAQGREERFGGSSGATPQVTAALLAFTLVSKWHLPPKFARHLLQQTALTFLTDDGQQVQLLNSLKIVELGFRWRERCAQQEQCGPQLLADPDFYHFAVDVDGVIGQAKEAFPQCFVANPFTAELAVASCSQRQAAFQSLRTAALLQGDRPELWQILACVSRWHGLPINGAFYQRLSQGQEDFSN